MKGERRRKKGKRERNRKVETVSIRMRTRSNVNVNFWHSNIIQIWLKIHMYNTGIYIRYWRIVNFGSLIFFRLFGCLDFHPTTGFKFWRELERVLQEKFVQFKPVEVKPLTTSNIEHFKLKLSYLGYMGLGDTFYLNNWLVTWKQETDVFILLYKISMLPGKGIAQLCFSISLCEK